MSEPIGRTLEQHAAAMRAARRHAEGVLPAQRRNRALLEMMQPVLELSEQPWRIRRERTCLVCGKPFPSQHAGHRRCFTCAKYDMRCDD